MEVVPGIRIIGTYGGVEIWFEDLFDLHMQELRLVLGKLFGMNGMACPFSQKRQ